MIGKTATLVLNIFLLLALIGYLPSFAEAEAFFVNTNNYENVYVISRAGMFSQKLYISITPSLYDYYRGQSHGLYDIYSYNKFITPEAVKPIAEELRKIFRDDELFANMVLSLVHRMRYVRSGPKYPVETLVENTGDCCALSFLAASIMMAGGLDVVLLRYSGSGVEHVNVGVFLPHSPIYHTLWISPKCYEFKGKNYWVAECTPFLIDWKVGDEPESLRGTNVRVIPIRPRGESPGCVSASLNFPLRPSMISIDVLPQNIIVNERVYSVQISGAVIPQNVTGAKVAAYVSRDGFSWELSTVTYVNKFGKYKLTCNLTSPGTYYVRVGWNGSSGYSGADSPILMFFVGPKSLIQFEGPGFNYTYGRVGLSRYELYTGIGAHEFLNLQLMGDKISIAGKFMLLKGKSSNENQILQMLSGLEPLRLPKDFNLKVRNALVLNLNKLDHNLSLQIRGLNQYDMLNMSQLNNKETLVLNLLSNVSDNSWYSFILETNGNTTFKLSDVNGALIEVFSYNGTAKNFGVILANIKDSIVVLKDFSVEVPEGSLNVPSGGVDLSFPSCHAVLIMSLITAVLIATFARTYKKVSKAPTCYGAWALNDEA